MHAPRPRAFRSPEAEPSSPTDQLEHWRELTQAALAAEREGHLAAALGLYGRALRQAESLFDNPRWPEVADNAMAALVVSHHNLADLLATLGRAADAQAHVLMPHHRLLTLAAGEQPAEVQSAAWRHQSETRRQLLLWRASLPDQPLTRAETAAAAELDAALAAMPPGLVRH